MLLLEPTQFLLPVPELERPLLLVQELVLLASVLVLPLLVLLAFSAQRLSLRLVSLRQRELLLAWLLALPQP